MLEKDKVRGSGHDGRKLGIVLVLAATLVATAALAVRSWDRQTRLRPRGQAVTSSIR
jgi:hypothetical protein